MKSGSCPLRFAALALSLFLSSKDEFFEAPSGGGGCGSVFVESFRAVPRATTMPASTTRGKYGIVGRGERWYSSSSRMTTMRLRVANPKTDPQGTSNFGGSSFNHTATTVDMTSDLAEAERAWALDATTTTTETAGGAVVVPEVLPPEEDEEAERSLAETLLSADVLGPFVSIVLTVGFLFYTLLNSGGISDNFATLDLAHKVDVLKRVCWFPGSFFEAKVVVGFVMAFSAFAQALTGFGFAVVAVGAMSSMPWLLHSELYDVITPVAATLGALVGFILLIPYAFAEGPPTEEEPGLDWGEILPLLIPCTVLTPLGIQLNSMVDPVLATRILAGLIMGFVAYKLVPTVQDALGSSNDDDGDADEMVTAAAAVGEAIDVTEEDADDGSPPEFLQSRAAAIALGSAAGIFGGAFDVQGPPLCVYGDAKGWSPAKFRNNVLAVVCLNSAFVVAIDFFEGALGDFYYSYFCLTSMPGVLLGVVAGQYASKRIDPVLFKNLVLVMCLGLGIQLLRVS